MKCSFLTHFRSSSTSMPPENIRNPLTNSVQFFWQLSCKMASISLVSRILLFHEPGLQNVRNSENICHIAVGTARERRLFYWNTSIIYLEIYGDRDIRIWKKISIFHIYYWRKHFLNSSTSGTASFLCWRHLKSNTKFLFLKNWGTSERHFNVLNCIT